VAGIRQFMQFIGRLKDLRLSQKSYWYWWGKYRPHSKIIQHRICKQQQDIHLWRRQFQTRLMIAAMWSLGPWLRMFDSYHQWQLVLINKYSERERDGQMMEIGIVICWKMPSYRFIRRDIEKSAANFIMIWENLLSREWFQGWFSYFCQKPASKRFKINQPKGCQRNSANDAYWKLFQDMRCMMIDEAYGQEKMAEEVFISFICRHCSWEEHRLAMPEF